MTEKAYNNQKLNGSIKDVVKMYNPTLGESSLDRLVWDIQHGIHCEGFTIIAPDGEVVQ